MQQRSTIPGCGKQRRSTIPGRIRESYLLSGVSLRSAGRSAVLSANIDAMTRMLVGMQVNPSGDADRDFAAMMTAHYQGAIGMAQAELRYGRDERLRRLAQEIIVTQQQEIEVMRHQIETPLPTANR